MYIFIIFKYLYSFRQFSGSDETNSFPVKGSEVRNPERDFKIQ